MQLRLWFVESLARVASFFYPFFVLNLFFSDLSIPSGAMNHSTVKAHYTSMRHIGFDARRTTHQLPDQPHAAQPLISTGTHVHLLI